MWVASALFISKEKKQMTQFSPLIGRHDYFLKGKVNNKVLSRILNTETIMEVMNDQQYEEISSKSRTEQSNQQSSVI